jgi:hypothetical protein
MNTNQSLSFITAAAARNYVDAKMALDVFSSNAPDEKFTEEMVEEVSRSIVLGAHRSTFGKVPGIRAARAEVLGALLGNNEVALRCAQDGLAAQILFLIVSCTAERARLTAVLKAVTEARRQVFASVAHEVLTVGSLVDTSELDDESLVAFAHALHAESNWNEDPEMLTRLCAQVEISAFSPAAMRMFTQANA